MTTHKNSNNIKSNPAVPISQSSITTSTSTSGGNTSPRLHSSSSHATPGDASQKSLLAYVKEFSKHDKATPFLDPLDWGEIEGYLEIIKKPMDFKTIENNVKKGIYENDFKSFRNDVFLIFTNCMEYNDPNSELYAWADELHQLAKESMKMKRGRHSGDGTVESSTTGVAGSSNASTMVGEPTLSKEEKKVIKANSKVNMTNQDSSSASVPILPIPISTSFFASATESASHNKRLSHLSTDNEEDEVDSPRRQSMNNEGSGMAQFGQTKIKRSDLGPHGMKCWKIIKFILRHENSRSFQYSVALKAACGLDISTIKNQLKSYDSVV